MADDVVLAAAVEGMADKIVTGDDNLLVLGDFEGIAIVTPRGVKYASPPMSEKGSARALQRLSPI